MTTTLIEDRCRLILVVPPLEAVPSADILRRALAGGDVATLIIPQYQLDDVAYEAMLSTWAPCAQEKGVAVVGATERRLVMRHSLDGMHLVAGASEVRTSVENQLDNLIIGASCSPTRHAALEMGEARPHYVFFGKFGGDKRAETHPKYLELAHWWAQMVEVPAILLAGNQVESIDEAARTGVDFVALSQAVFGPEIDDPLEVVRLANATLEKYLLTHEE
ncbi:MAG: thiamine phosphate synthase [Pseudomonadota bacterium]